MPPDVTPAEPSLLALALADPAELAAPAWITRAL
jgi:hypothetical protein